MTGSVPDVRPYIARSWVMAVPLRLGGGTRLKIMESMASALPIVSTTVGAEGTGVTNGEQLLLADTPQRFVEQTARLLGVDPPLPPSLAGLDTKPEHYDKGPNDYGWFKDYLKRVFK